MTTQIICGNPSQILEMQRMLSVISTILTPLPHMPSPLIQQTSFCSFKSDQSCLLKLTAWKLIFRRGVVLQSHLRDYTFNRLSQFFTFHLILSDCFRLQTMRRFSMRTHLSHALHHFTNTCLPHGKPCSIKLNLILDSPFPCCAWLMLPHTCTSHMFHASLPFCHHHAVTSSL